MLFCEIDCREGILVAVERCRYKDLAEGIRVVVGIYMDQLRILRDEYQLQVRCACFSTCVVAPAKCAHTLMRWPALLMDWLWQLFVHPIVPVLNETRTIVRQFNKEMARQVRAEPGVEYLDFFEAMLTSRGKVCAIFVRVCAWVDCGCECAL